MTEFLPPVPWAGKYNTIPDAAGHHIQDGRWLRDNTVLDDYITFWFLPDEDGGQSPHTRSYTTWFGQSVMAYSAVTGNESWAVARLPGLIADYAGWVAEHYLNTTGDQCFTQTDNNDAMEDSISGNGCRPTINAAMHSNARAIAALAGLAQNSTLQAEWQLLASQLQNRTLQLLWNENLTTFAVYKPAQSASAAASASAHSRRQRARDVAKRAAQNASLLEAVGRAEFDKLWAAAGHARRANGSVDDELTCPPTWPDGQLVQVRELLGLAAPWYWQLIPADPDMVANYSRAWAQLWDPQGFYAPWGPRTAERRHPCYNYTVAHECTWNGPSWPYETSRLLAGLANLLQDYPPQSVVGPADFWELLKIYARSHLNAFAINGTRPWIGEDLHPDDGYWLAREIMYGKNESDRNRGDHYNHSSFIDLIISGLLGLRAALGSVFTVNPLVTGADPSSPNNAPGSLAYFALDNVLYHGHNLTLFWDADGTRYGKGPGFQVICDGATIYSAASLGKASVDLQLCPPAVG